MVGCPFLARRLGFARCWTIGLDKGWRFRSLLLEFGNPRKGSRQLVMQLSHLRAQIRILLAEALNLVFVHHGTEYSILVG